jgi:hypothetical protein
MNLEELETHLDKGEQWGIRKETDSHDYLGWILITKRRPPTIWPRNTYDDPNLYSSLMDLANEIIEKPYHMQVLELRRDVHESGEYENTEDYRQNENYYFETLGEAERMVERLGYSIKEIKFRGELDAP